MKILLATTAIIPKGGGIASYNQELLNAFSETTSFSVLTEEPLSEYPGIEKIYSAYGRNCYSLDFCEEIVKKINNDCYDIIINSSSLLMSIIAPYVNAPICSVSHFVDGKLAFLAGFNSQYISRIVALSFYGKKHIEDTFKIVDNDKVQVVYNFVHSNEDSIDTSKKDLRPLTIVYPGGTSIKKSFDIVMRTLRKLIKTKLDFKFYWLGGTTLPSAKLCLASNLSKLIKKDNRVVFTGRIPREDAMAIMNIANIFLLPSRGEGCPMTLLEAIQGGCIPIVSDARHGSREILENGNFGVIVKNEDSNSLFDALCDILKYPDKYSDNYVNTYQYSRDCLSEEKWIDSMRKIIYECISCSKEFVNINKIHFEQNVRSLRWALYKERVVTMCDSLKSSIICNLFYITK